MKKISFLLFFIFTTVSLCFGQAIKKQNISVLYVGDSPSMPVVERGLFGISKDRQVEDHASRMPAFESLLKKYFSRVETVDARNYNEEMSNNFDVTIFDAETKQIKPPVSEEDDKGRSTKYEQAHYLTENFDRPAILMSQYADRLGRAIGLKLDWCCLCLFSHALNTKWEHPIFKGPYKTDFTIEDRKTPDGAKRYESGKNLPEKLPMWRVQTESSSDEKGYYTGMVSRSAGFMDSPDTEFVSSGECLKDYDAVALGRHGNFFLWGFAADPNYMTEEAKIVYINAIVYISKFAGQKPVARKWNDRLYIRNQTDRRNNPYDYATKDGGYKSITDKDVKSLGIPNYDVKLLDKAISMLEKGENSEMALRILKKYTLKEFKSAKEWRKWYKDNRKNLFFTDAGGYVFLVNNGEDQYPMNEDRSLEVVKKEQPKPAVNKTDNATNAEPVTAKFDVENTMTGKRALLTLSIKPKNHIYAKVSASIPMHPTKIEFIFPENLTAEGDVVTPPSVKYNEEGSIYVYKDKVVFSQKFSGTATAGQKVICKFSYQCCDDTMCHNPEEKTLTFTF